MLILRLQIVVAVAEVEIVVPYDQIVALAAGFVISAMPFGAQVHHLCVCVCERERERERERDRQTERERVLPPGPARAGRQFGIGDDLAAPYSRKT